jgi:hypothetical protein
MNITKVSITSKGVRLMIEKEDGKGGTEERQFKCKSAPLGVFSDAMQGLKPFVLKILKGAVTLNEASLRLTTVSLSETKDGRRGVVFSGVVAVPGVNNNPLVLNTPFVTELADGVQAKNDTVAIDDTVDELIDALLEQAEKYYKGSRGQVEMELSKPKTDNEKAVDEKMAEASVKSTRVPRGAKKAEEPDTAKAANSKPETIREGLSAVGKNVPVDAIKQWGTEDRAAAIAWANNSAAGIATNMPLCIQRDAVRQQPAEVQ